CSRMRCACSRRLPSRPATGRPPTSSARIRAPSTTPRKATTSGKCVTRLLPCSARSTRFQAVRNGGCHVGRRSSPFANLSAIAVHGEIAARPAERNGKAGQDVKQGNDRQREEERGRCRPDKQEFHQ